MTDSNAVFGSSTPKETMTAGISTLSANVSYVETNLSSAETDYELYTTWRLSQTSVSVDEEAAKLESYQLSYNASAKVIEIWNEVIEATIGLVGG
jgi:flagellar hook-associated protein 1 FlgK